VTNDEEKDLDAALAELARRARAGRKQEAEFVKGKRRAPPDHWREAHSNRMAMFEREWLRTRNPLWVWRAIAAGAVGCGKRAPLFPLPTWCAAYLHTVASRLDNLAHGQDWRKPPKEPPHDADVSARGTKVTREIGPDAAMDAIPAALGLRRQGWNAFSADAAAETRERDLLRMAQLLGIERSKAAARRAFMAETGRTDEDTVRQLQRDAEQWMAARRVSLPF
jgi:hypothetical protein